MENVLPAVIHVHESELIEIFRQTLSIRKAATRAVIIISVAVYSCNAAL